MFINHWNLLHVSVSLVWQVKGTLERGCISYHAKMNAHDSTLKFETYIP
jgi:hypothetical protein